MAAASRTAEGWSIDSAKARLLLIAFRRALILLLIEVEAVLEVPSSLKGHES